MAWKPRSRPQVSPTAISIAALTATMSLASVPASAAATPTVAPRIAPVPKVDLGAPDPRCSDLAYPLWDDGMCVRAKCADEYACAFSGIAGAARRQRRITRRS